MAALWARSYWRADSWCYYFSPSAAGHGKEMFGSAKGIVIFSHDVTVESQPLPETERIRGFRAFSFPVTKHVDPLSDIRRHFFGFGYDRDAFSPGPGGWQGSRT